MRILIDGRTIRENPAGVGYTVVNLLKELKKYSDLDLVVITRKGVKKIPGISNIVVHETEHNYQFSGLKRFFFEQIELPRLIKKYQPNILHLTDSFGIPYLTPQKLKIVVTLHDLIPLTKYRELMTVFGYLTYNLSIKSTLSKADKIVCVSNFTQNDLHNFFPSLSPKKITVIYDGIKSPIFKENEDFKKSVFNKYDIRSKYVFYLGGFPPRKNVLGLIKAFYLFNAKFNNSFQLVLSGRQSLNPDIKKNIELIKQLITEKKLENHVIILDYLMPKEKNILLKNAFFFAYLSFYEGFGLPVLEALSLETPVLTSKNSAMEEIAGRFTLCVDPYDIDDIVEKMAELSNNYHYYKKRAKEAKTKLIPQFSWKRIGELYNKIYLSQLQFT